MIFRLREPREKNGESPPCINFDQATKTAAKPQPRFTSVFSYFFSPANLKMRKKIFICSANGGWPKAVHSWPWIDPNWKWLARFWQGLVRASSETIGLSRRAGACTTYVHNIHHIHMHGPVKGLGRSRG